MIYHLLENFCLVSTFLFADIDRFNNGLLRQIFAWITVIVHRHWSFGRWIIRRAFWFDKLYLIRVFLNRHCRWINLWFNRFYWASTFLHNGTDCLRDLLWKQLVWQILYICMKHWCLVSGIDLSRILYDFDVIYTDTHLDCGMCIQFCCHPQLSGIKVLPNNYSPTANTTKIPRFRIARL